MSIPSLAPSVIIQSALNALLRREPWASDELSQYAGKTVLLKFAGKNILQTTINSTGGLDACDSAVVADVVLNMPYTDLAELLSTFRASGADGIAKQMHIQGDAGLAQLLADLARNLRWDAQADLARVVGDIAAVRITGFMNFAFNSLQDGARRFNSNIQEYMSIESGLTVKQASFQTLQTNLADLNQRLDKIDARLGKLAGH